MDIKASHDFSKSTLHAQLALNLEFLDKSLHPLYQYLSPYIDNFISSVKVRKVEKENDFSIFLGQECIYQQYYNSQEKEIFPEGRIKFDRISINRYPKKTTHTLLDVKRFSSAKVYNNILYVKSDFISEHLPCNNAIKDASSSESRKYRYVTVLGSGLLSTYFRLINIKKINLDCSMIFLVEDNPIEFLIFLMFNDLRICVDFLKSNKVGLQLLCESDPEAIKLRLIDMMLTKNIFSVYGTAILKSSNISPTLMEVDTWLHAGDGLRQYLYANLGNMSDEINQSLQTYCNLSDSVKNTFLTDQVFDVDALHVLVSSGPSASQFLPELSTLKAEVRIVACGSALGELLNAGIVPDYLVVLERNSHVYADFLELSCQFDFSSIHLIACASSDPRLKTLFPETTLFFRGASACTRLFKESHGSSLAICGPNVVNAALEIFLVNKVKKILLLGTDFGARIDAAELRAPNATGGRYKRQLTMPVMGNQGRTIFSDNRLLVCRTIVEYLIKEYSDTQVYRLGEGAVIEGALELASIDQFIELVKENVFANIDLDAFLVPSNTNTNTNTNTNATEISYDRLKTALFKWRDELKASVDGASWNLSLHRELNSKCSRYFPADESPEDGFIRHLTAHPLFVVLMSYYDGSSKASFDENIDVLVSLVDPFIRLLSEIQSLSRDPDFEYKKEFLLDAFDTF